MDFEKLVYSYVLWEKWIKNLHRWVCSAFQLWGQSHNFNAGTSWTGELHQHPLALHNQSPYIHSRFLTTARYCLLELSLLTVYGIWYTFICPGTWI